MPKRNKFTCSIDYNQYYPEELWKFLVKTDIPHHVFVAEKNVNKVPQNWIKQNKVKDVKKST